MDIVKSIMNFGQLLPINLLLKSNIDQTYIDTIIIPALHKITQHNKLPLSIVKGDMIVFHDEIVIKFNPPYFHILCSHEFYDGKVISNLCMQLNHYIEHKKFLDPITKKTVDRSIGSTLFRSIGTKLINEGVLGKRQMTIIKIFDHPIKPSFIVNYIQNLEQKNIIYLRAHKEKNAKQGNSFNIYKISKDQSLKEALSKNQIITKMDVPNLLINQNSVIVNLYPHFHIPNFTEKIIFDESNRSISLLSKITSVISVKTYFLLPKSASNTYDLYEVI